MRSGRGPAFGLVLALAGLVLSACYASDALLLDPDAAVQPLAEGVYVREGDPSDRFRLTLEASGWYDVERYNDNGSTGETRRALFNALDPVAGRPAYAVAISGEDGFVYATVLIGRDSAYLALPDCGDPLDRNLAVDQGAELSDDEAMTRNCTFHDRGALVAALTAYSGQADFGRPYQRH